MSQRSFLLVSATACAIVLAPAASAIVVRHDRPDARYVNLAKGFRAYGDVVEAGSTLIAPRWLLTAGHVAKEISPYTSVATINGRKYTVDRVIFHPDYAKERSNGRRDLALLRLSKPVRGVEPIPLYREKDEVEQTVTFMGRGQTGNGETGPTGEDGKMRGATNKLERADEVNVFFKFDPPETGTDLEGISGPGDSGGPALLKVRGKWAIAGVSSANMRSGNAKGPCRYETTEVYARVSTAVDWIDETMGSSPPSTIAWKTSTLAEGWPKSRPGEVASALIDAYNSGDAAVMEVFNQKYRDAQSLGRGTPDGRATGYGTLFKRIGRLAVVEYAEDPAERLLVLLRNEKGRHYQLSLYFLDRENARFDGYWIGEAAPRAR